MTVPMPKSWRPREVREKVIALVKKGLTASDDTPVGNEIAYVADLAADSIDLVELVLELETAFEIEIPDNEALKFKTVGETIAWIIKKLKEAGRLVQ